MNNRLHIYLIITLLTLVSCNRSESLNSIKEKEAEALLVQFQEAIENEEYRLAKSFKNSLSNDYPDTKQADIAVRKWLSVINNNLDVRYEVEENRMPVVQQEKNYTEANSKPFKVFDLEKFEDASKAQIKVSAALECDFNDKSELESTLTTIYNQYKDYSDFKRYSSPTVTAVYLFTSEKQGRDMPSGWLAMLVKPTSSPPRITINDSRYRAMLSSKDDVVTKEEKEVADLKNYLSSRGLDLCSLFKMIGDMERRNGEKAYQKFPNSALESVEYQEQLNEVDRQSMRKKYRLNKPDIFASVNAYGFDYCM